MPLVYRPPLPTKPKPAPAVMKLREHRPWLCPVLMILTIIGMGAIGVYLCQKSIQNLTHNKQFFLQQHLYELEENKHKINSLTAQNQELRNKLAMIVRTTQQNQKTYAQVLQSLSQLQDKQRDLKEELLFYKNLLTSPISPNLSEPKVVVANLTLHPDQTAQHYHYKLVLTQSNKTAQLVKGQVEISIQGQMNNQTQRLDMKQLTANRFAFLEYELRYFQRLENDFQLPNHFIPKSLTVRLLPMNQNQTYKFHFKWAQLQPKESL